MYSEVSRILDCIGTKNDSQEVVCIWDSPVKTAACHDHVEYVEMLIDRLRDRRLLDDITKADGDSSAVLMLVNKDDHIECVKCVIKDPVLNDDLKSNDGLRTTALTLSGKNDQVECVLCSLHAGLVVDVNRKDNFASKELLLAASIGQEEFIRCLTNTESEEDEDEDEDPCPIIQANVFAESSFIRASMNGYVQCVKHLLETGLVDINKKDSCGLLGFLLAVKHGHVDCVRYLLDSGFADLTMEDDNGRTGLLIAAKSGQLECLKYFLDTGSVDVNTVDNCGSTALMLAADNGHAECVELLLDTGLVNDIDETDTNGKTALMLASRRGSVRCVRRLLDTGLIEDVEIEDNHGNTAIMLAAWKGHFQCVKFFLETGLVDEINVENDKGDTVFMLASMSGKVECVEYLLGTGMVDDVNRADDFGDTALLLASMNGRVDCVKYLLSTGLIDDINKANKKGNNALMHAAMFGHYRIVKCLLQTGSVDIKQRNEDGCTAFELASCHGHSECFDLLLNAELADNIRGEDIDGSRAFMLATENGHVVFVQRLLDMGMVHSLCKQDSEGQTAFLLALSGGNIDCLRCILDIAVSDDTPTNPDIAVRDGTPTKPDIAMTNGIPKRENAHQDVNISSSSVFVPNDSNTCLTYCPGITWNSPYVYDRDQKGQSTLKLVVGRGLSRCVVCLMLGDLDVSLTPHSVCRHEGLERSTFDFHHQEEKTPLWVSMSKEQDHLMDYALQFERIRLHFLVVLLRENFLKTAQISLALYKRLSCLIWNPDQVDYFLGMFCNGSHLGLCLDFLLSAIICQKDICGRNTLRLAEINIKWNNFETLLHHVRIHDCESLSDSIRDAFLSISYYNENLRRNLFLRNGFFLWPWYPHFSRGPRDLARALVVNGYSPGEFQWQGESSSPLHHALTTGDEGLARYLVANLYLTSRDLDHRRMDRELRKQVLDHDSESLHRFHRQVFGSPWRLRDLSFVKVSTLLRCKVRRVDMAPVDSLLIPQALKRQLAFVNGIRMADFTA